MVAKVARQRARVDKVNTIDGEVGGARGGPARLPECDEAGLRELPRSALFDGQPRLDVSGSTYVRENLSSTQVEHDCVCMMANYTLKRPGASRVNTPSSPLRPRIGSLQ